MVFLVKKQFGIIVFKVDDVENCGKNKISSTWQRQWQWPVSSLLGKEMIGGPEMTNMKTKEKESEKSVIRHLARFASDIFPKELRRNRSEGVQPVNAHSL